MNIYLNRNLYSLAILLSALLITSCDDVADKMTVEEPESLTLSELDITEIELDQTNPENPVATFVWSKPDYGQQTVKNYDLEFSETENFENAVVVSSLRGNRDITFTTRELNSAVGDIGLPPSEWNTAYARITASLGRSQNELPVTSNIISFEVYPYFFYPFDDFYMVGPATASGWANDNNNPVMFRSADDPNEFSYTGFFNADQVKILEYKGAWAPQYGEDEQGELKYRPTEDDPDPAPIDDFTTAGYYKFTADIGSLEFTIEQADGSVPALTSLSISGSAVEDGNVVLNQYSVNNEVFEPHLWQNTTVHLLPGEVLFQANDSEAWGGETTFSGVATQGGDPINIPVEDDYEVWFNDLTNEYMFIPQNF